jgi:hypothetical protein
MTISPVVPSVVTALAGFLDLQYFGVVSEGSSVDCTITGPATTSRFSAESGSQEGFYSIITSFPALPIALSVRGCNSPKYLEGFAQRCCLF